MKTLMQDTNGKFLLKIFLLFGVLTLGLINKNLELDDKLLAQNSGKLFLNSSVLAD